MGGNWNENPLPIRPGSYINFESSGSAPVQPGDFGRVGMPVRATWGPANEFVEVVTDADRRATFGHTDGDPSDADDTSWLIREAIIGGAELVKAYRIVGAGAEEAEVDLDDWLGTATVQLTAAHVGTRANDFNITIGASPIFADSAVLRIVENSNVLESYTYPEDDLEVLVADINANSRLVEATLLVASETDEVTTFTVAQGAELTGGTFNITINFGDGSSPQTTADIAFDDSLVADVQTAIDAALVAGGYSAGDIDVELTDGTDGLDNDHATDPTVYTLTATGGLANQNISITVADGATPLTPALPGAIVVATVEQGGRSPLAFGTFAMAGGLDGAAPTLSDYVDVMAAFEADGGFDLFALDGVSEEDFAGLNAALKVWAETNNEAGRYLMAVTGGGATELADGDIATALGRSALFDTEWVVNIGVSGLRITTPAGNEIELTAAQSAPRLAGMIASAGITGSITFGEVAGADVNGPVSPSQIETMIQQGVVVFSRRGDVVRVEDGITTFISLTEQKDFTFTQIRAVRAIQQIGIDVSDIVEEDWIGKKINTTSVRDSLVARLREYFGVLEGAGVLVNGTEVQIDTRYDNTTTNVYILVLAQFQFELKKVLLTVRVPTVS